MNITLRSDAYVARVSFELRIVISRKGRAYRSKFSSVNIVSRNFLKNSNFISVNRWIHEFTCEREREKKNRTLVKGFQNFNSQFQFRTSLVNQRISRLHIGLNKKRCYEIGYCAWIDHHVKLWLVVKERNYSDFCEFQNHHFDSDRSFFQSDLW